MSDMSFKCYFLVLATTLLTGMSHCNDSDWPGRAKVEYHAPQEYTQQLVASTSRTFIDHSGQAENLTGRLLGNSSKATLLYGISGVGKTSLVKEAYRRMLSSNSNSPLIWHVDVLKAVRVYGPLFSNFRSNELVKILHRAIAYGRTHGGPNDLFFIDNLYALFLEHSDAANVWKSFLDQQQGKTTLIFAVRPDHLRDRLPIEDTAFERRFHFINVHQPQYPAVLKTVQLMQGNWNVPVTQQQMETATKMAVVHLHWLALPGSVELILDDAVRQAKVNGRSQLTDNDILQAVANWAHMPLLQIQSSQQQVLAQSDAFYNGIIKDNDELQLSPSFKVPLQELLKNLRRNIRDGLNKGVYTSVYKQPYL